MREGTLRLAGSARYQVEIMTMEVGSPLVVEEDWESDGYLVIGADGSAIGHFTAKSWPAAMIAEGGEVLHCSVNSIGDDGDRVWVNVRIAVGDAGEEPETPASKSYPVGLVGESQCQEALAQSPVGSTAHIHHEIGNPHDPLALVATNVSGEPIGYIPRSSWLRAAIHEEGKGCSAVIEEIARAPNGMLGAVVRIQLRADPIPTRAFPSQARDQEVDDLLREAQPTVELAAAPAVAKSAVPWWKRFLGLPE